MLRIRGIGLYSAGPLSEGYIELGDVTVLVGPNDSGKTRALLAIERALTDRDESQGAVNVYGMASRTDVDALLDRSAADEEEIISEAGVVAEFRRELEVPVAEGQVLLGVSAIEGVALLPAWSYGRSLAELPDDVRAQVAAAIAPGHAWIPDPGAPITLEFLGGVEPAILPEVVSVPSASEHVEAESGLAVLNLCLWLRFVNHFWALVEEEAGELEGVPDRDWAPSAAGEDSLSGLSSRWLLDEHADATSHHPAAVLACETLARLASDLLPDFVGRDYEVCVSPAPPTDIARGTMIMIELRVLQPGEDAAEKRFPLGDAASGFAVWLQLALREATANLKTLSQILESGLDRVHEIGMQTILHDADRSS